MSVIRFWRSGDPFIWLAGAALAVCLLMVIGLVSLILINGLALFWPTELVQFRLNDGSAELGQIVRSEEIPHAAAESGHQPTRIQIRRGNRDLNGMDFVWLDEAKITERAVPTDAVILERIEWGNAHGFLKEVRAGAAVIAREPAACAVALDEHLPRVQEVLQRIHAIETEKIGSINNAQERIRLELRALELEGVASGEQVDALRAESRGLQEEFAQQAGEIAQLRAGLTMSLVLASVSGQDREIPLAQVVRCYRPNAMGWFAKAGFYLAKLREFIADDPREANTEGGVWPAIFGTVMMVMLMSLMVTPLGIIAALYMREYAKQGPLVSVVRIAVNNLAGVPSIVFGVFGVGFFIHGIGGGIDQWLHPEALPAPTYGTGGILWASLTLALLTVPVVIVATEEGLAAIPKGTREASLALGATKFETTWRVVLPALTPSILTGMILALARAAGEVAPLMITGVVKLAPALPVDGEAPFVHLERKFMHLGFHIYDVGFQSPNVDAARPMVFATTMLLLVIVVALNLFAIVLRRKLRKKYALSGL